MLKFEVDSLDQIDEAFRGLYQETDGKFKIKIDGMPEPEDVSGLKSKVDQLLAEKKAEAEKRKAAEQQAADDAAAAAQKAGDVDAINASWQKKYDKAVADLTAKLDQTNGALHQVTAHAKAVELATSLAVPGSADVLLPHIEPRLAVEQVDGKAVIKVKDASGKPSALSIEELAGEIAANKIFAPLIAASNSSGGGATGNNNGGRAASQKTATRSDFNTWTPTKQREFSLAGGTLTD